MIKYFHELTKQWMPYILDCVKRAPWQTSILLTKCPQNLQGYDYPENCWVGVSATNTEMALEAWEGLADIDAKVRFISFEPLQERILMRDLTVIDWLIIGQQTPVKAETSPKIEWIKEIVEAADKAKIPLFLKNNLNSLAICDYPELLDKNGNLRQEFPLVHAQQGER